jgi:hypothetical protein
MYLGLDKFYFCVYLSVITFDYFIYFYISHKYKVIFTNGTWCLSTPIRYLTHNSIHKTVT